MLLAICFIFLLPACSYLTVKNEQQTDLGPRRKPSGNPSTHSSPAASGALNPDAMRSLPNYPQAMQEQQMVPSRQTIPQNGTIPLQNQGQYGAEQSPYGSNPNSSSPQMPPMPPMPSQGAGPSDFQVSNPSDGFDNDPGADAAYSRGIMGGGSGGGESKRKWWQILPSSSQNYKMERKFEPLAAEFSVKNHEVNSKRSASMFPLEEYAPKPINAIQNMADNNYPNLGKVPGKPSNITNTDTAAKEMEAMKKEAEEAEAARAKTHQTEEKNKDTKPDVKIEQKPEARFPENTDSLKNDAAFIKIVTPIPAVNTPKTQENSFFSGLYHKIFSPKPKQVWRKSEPPVSY